MVTVGGNERWRALYVSAVLGGGDAMSHVDSAISRLARITRCQEEAFFPADSTREASIDVTFHVPGTIWPVDFEGIRPGRWIKKKRLLVVQVAVPDSLAGALAGETNRFLSDSLQAAVEVGAADLSKKGLDLSLEHARLIAERSAVALAT